SLLRERDALDAQQGLSHGNVELLGLGRGAPRDIDHAFCPGDGGLVALAEELVQRLIDERDVDEARIGPSREVGLQQGDGLLADDRETLEEYRLATAQLERRRDLERRLHQFLTKDLGRNLHVLSPKALAQRGEDRDLLLEAGAAHEGAL